MSHPEGEIVTEQRGALWLMGIKRPAKLNGFTPKMMGELGAAYSAMETRDDVMVGVLHAFGDHFTAGLDLPAMAPLMREGRSAVAAEDIDPFDLRASALGARRQKPLVAAVRGITYTLGIELMLAADVVIAGADCRFAQLEVKRGIMATGGATIRIAERAGLGNAQWLLLTGDEFYAADALRMGLVQQVVAPEAVFDRALAVAERIAAQAPLAVRATRANVLLAQRAGADAALAQFSAIQSQLSQSRDAQEGVRSFMERRPAQFVGE